jgi:hypothetical protein
LKLLEKSQNNFRLLQLLHQILQVIIIDEYIYIYIYCISFNCWIKSCKIVAMWGILKKIFCISYNYCIRSCKLYAWGEILWKYFVFLVTIKSYLASKQNKKDFEKMFCITLFVIVWFLGCCKVDAFVYVQQLGKNYSCLLK